jgi:hypothetical protein
LCKHTIGLAIKLKLVSMPERLRGQPLVRKAKLGRKLKAKHAYSIQPFVEDPVESVQENLNVAERSAELIHEHEVVAEQPVGDELNLVARAVAAAARQPDERPFIQRPRGGQRGGAAAQGDARGGQRRGVARGGRGRARLAIHSLAVLGPRREAGDGLAHNDNGDPITDSDDEGQERDRGNDNSDCSNAFQFDDAFDSLGDDMFITNRQIPPVNLDSSIFANNPDLLNFDLL